MTKFEQKVLPGVGLGQLILGSSKDEVTELLGKPSHEEVLDYGDGVPIHMWEFEDEELSVTFAQDDGFRLGSITTGHDATTLFDLPIIAISEADLLKTKFGSMAAPELEEDGDEAGKYYGWDDENLSCWVADGFVISISIMPLYDPSGEIPVWPNPAN